MKIKTALMVFLSCGWLIPLNLGISTLFSWLQYEVTPLLEGRYPGNSFPFIKFSEEMIAVSFIWLGMAIAVWVLIYFRKHEK
ncbi:MAG: hypothetical protein GYA12_02525 [Chloroflexi bacterium]|jgi:hypothetical protein|nr:hypothetical protein [Chloroflexota bacterium]BCY17611.1 hypothetical protein hrd7_14600 [Leptolinea sp. HRD-7]